jgi:C4-dicarboxylate transporter/malic acid transport protein
VLTQIIAPWRPLQRVSHPREIVRQFTPNWFTLTMGTGILFLMLAQFPLAIPGLVSLTRVLFWGDGALYLIFALLFAARWIWFTADAKKLLDHPVMSMFLGAIPMGLAPIINGLVGFYPHSPLAVRAALDLWYGDVVLALIIGWLVPFFMFTRQTHHLTTMTGVWLLPIVPAEVAAVSAGTIAPHLATASAQIVVMIGYGLWALSVPLAFGILAILFLRLALHKLPHREMAVSTWLTLGPIGTGSTALIVLGNAAASAFAGQALEPIFLVAKALGVVGGLLLWGVGLWWLGMAMMITIRYLKEGLPFNMGWWGFTFPLGVYTGATYALAASTGYRAFEIFAAALTLLLVFFWSLVTSRTLHGMWHGHLFAAPCLAQQSA